jgi:Na+-transporting NADH:ubiquinone oxidoreductase subunit NqrB
LKLGLSYLFISRWGLGGAALSAAVTDFAAVVWVWCASQRVYPLAIEWRKIAAIGGTAVGLFLAAQLADESSRRYAATAAAPIHGALSRLVGPGGREILTLERVGAVVNAAMVSALAGCFLLLTPYVRPGLVTRLWRRARELASRGWKR